ncbi:Uncharacterized protein TCAP_04140 [Tolypocladium capitatum]|uniref:C2H2-type domain-containing protein n=1 Tax=Tolypocladium capitatum TaxID=45235 RepID=A0A2K3QEH7_9HYPO|nr:Uncharacterized protein TCAP_04140 [Tolypocladium capitatum]
MAFPPQYREPAPTLPSIIAPGTGRYRAHHDVPFGRSPAISIPGLGPQDDVPPPLPPPRILPFGDAPQQPEDMKRDHREYGHGSSSFASGYSSMGSSFADERPNFKRRDTGSTVNGDEGYCSYASPERSRDSLPAEFGLHHNKFHFQTPADLHTDSIKKKLDPIRTFDKSPPRSLLTSSVGDLSRRHPDTRLPPALKMPVQLPIHSRPLILESPARFAETPMYSAASPRSAPFRLSPVDQRPHHDASDLDRSPRARSRRNNSDDATSTQGSYEFTGAEDMEIDEASSMKRLHIDDTYAAAGQKRRAASPPAEEILLHCVSGQSDIVRRRDVGSRGSPTPRLALIPQASSVSAMSPAAVSRSNSYMSTVSMPHTNNTPANSYGRRSPGGTSPGGASPTSCSSPYTTPASLTHSPRTSISGRNSTHTRTTSAASPRKLTEIQKPGGGSRLQGFLMCECCPKKPKKFDTAEELSAHEAEKQYECSFCGNRFKNKNEAERHQNSLHVRRHSWSCSALSGYGRAFHDSTNRPGEADTCGYCGDEFPRSGGGDENGALGIPRHATEKDWEERIRHLQDVHKFRECNSAKKFYRADHFRQHLKHSHAGTSGKWTNMLENACMVEEDPSPR